jgi:hypothetical protein
MPLDHQQPRLASPWGPSMSMGTFRANSAGAKGHWTPNQCKPNPILVRSRVANVICFRRKKGRQHNADHGSDL